MIKEIPGYLNFIIMLWVYYFAFWLMIDKMFFPEFGQFVDLHRFVYCMFFSGGYMAKWRYVNGSWNFNGSFKDFILHFVLGMARK